MWCFIVAVIDFKCYFSIETYSLHSVYVCFQDGYYIILMDHVNSNRRVGQALSSITVGQSLHSVAVIHPCTCSSPEF